MHKLLYFLFVNLSTLLNWKLTNFITTKINRSFGYVMAASCDQVRCWWKGGRSNRVRERKTLHSCNNGVSFQMLAGQQTGHPPVGTSQPQNLMVVNPSVGNTSAFYNCSFCNFRTNMKEELRNHTNWHHQDGWLHACSQCDYKTRRSNDLKRHVTTRHEGTILRPYRCSWCSYRTTCTSYLQHHLTTKHHNHSRYIEPPECPSSNLSTPK